MHGTGLIRAARFLTYLVYAFVLVALTILAFGFFLLLFGANPDAQFAEWVYRSLARVMAPFRGLVVPRFVDQLADSTDKRCASAQSPLISK